MKAQCVDSKSLYMYVAERSVKRLREEEDLSVNELQPKKKDRSLLLGKKLDNAVQEYT